MLLQTSTDKCHGCTTHTFALKSVALGGTWASFAVALPPGATAKNPVPVIWFFPGIMVGFRAGFIEGGFLAHAAEARVGMIFPDSSPRGTGMEEELEDYRLGPGSAYQADCTKEPWSRYYRMFTYLTQELPQALANQGLPLDFSRQSIIGHSGGGHAAMQYHLLMPKIYRSASGIAPYCDLMRSEIGQAVIPRMFEGGFDEMVKINVPDMIKGLRGKARDIKILVSIGTADYALRPGSMMVDNLRNAIEESEITEDEIRLQYDEGHTHSYFYVSTVAKQHIDFHAEVLRTLPSGSLKTKGTESDQPPWQTRPIRRSPLCPPDITTKQWIEGLASTHAVLIFIDSGHPSPQIRKDCENSGNFVATRPWPDEELLVLDVDGHSNKSAIQSYFKDHRGTQQYPACFVHGRFCGAMGNLFGQLSGLRADLGRAGP